MVDDADVAAQLFSLLQVMRGEDDSDALAVELGEEGPHRAAQLNVHPRRRLVENQQAWLMDQRPGNHQAPLHTPGQRTRRHVALVPQAELGQVLLGPLLGHLHGNAVVTRLGHHDVEGLFELVEVELLGHDADTALERRRLAIQIVTEDIHGTAGFIDQCRKNTNGRGFASAVGAQQREEVTLGHVQVNTMQSLETIAVGFCKLPDG
ncbi:hypothetical protein D3C85_843730 [compost metagenome]